MNNRCEVFAEEFSVPITLSPGLMLVVLREKAFMGF
jgi:hypothetical protein